MTWLWDTLYPRLLVTFIWSTLRNWHSGRRLKNHRCGFDISYDTFVIWPHGPDRLQEFFFRINGIRATIQFTMKREANNKIPILDAHVIRKQSSIITTAYTKPTHTGRFLNFLSNHPPHVKRGIIRSLHNRATIICLQRHDLAHELNNPKHDLQLNGFPPKLINSVNNTWGKNRLRNDVKLIGSLVIPYAKGISDKFKRIGNRYKIRTIFTTKYTLRKTLVRTRPTSDPQLTAHCIYNIPCDCGRSYVGETGRHIAVRIGEHKFNLKKIF
jgi:hypothetical protein